jgi:hypothetical protein
MDARLLTNKLNQGTPTAFLLSGARFLDSQSRDFPEVTDPRNFPFYYYLGQQCCPQNVIQIGPRLGLPAFCFLQGCKSVKAWLVLDQNDGMSRTILSNVQRHLQGQAAYWSGDPDFIRRKICIGRWDLALVTGRYESELRDYLYDLWENLTDEGLLVVDYISFDSVSKVFHEFCRVKNREPMTFITRNGIGIIQR